MNAFVSSGGGIISGKLSLATASENDVVRGKTFYSGLSKKMQTGNLVERLATTNASSLTHDSARNLFARIPYGVYRSDAGDGHSQIKIPRSNAISELGLKNVSYTWTCSNNQQGRPINEVMGYFTVKFKIGNTNVTISGSSPKKVNSDGSGSGTFTVT